MSKYNELISKIASEIVDERAGEIQEEKLEKRANGNIEPAQERVVNPQTILGLKNRDNYPEYQTMAEFAKDQGADTRRVLKKSLPIGTALGAGIGIGSGYGAKGAAIGAGIGALGGTIPATYYANFKGVQRDNAAAQARYAGNPKAISQAKALGPQFADWRLAKREAKAEAKAKALEQDAYIAELLRFAKKDSPDYNPEAAAELSNAYNAKYASEEDFDPVLDKIAEYQAMYQEELEKKAQSEEFKDGKAAIGEPKDKTGKSKDKKKVQEKCATYLEHAEMLKQAAMEAYAEAELFEAAANEVLEEYK